MSADPSADAATWCDNCSAYRDGGTVCAECGHAFPEAAESGGGSAPWHFWLIVIALAGYLLWRLIQGIWWLVA